MTKEPTHEIGVLLIHGIGQHSRGDTLVNYGQPIAKWIQDWVDGWSNSTRWNDIDNWETYLRTLTPSITQIDDPELDTFRQANEFFGGRYTPEVRRALDRLIFRLKYDETIHFVEQDPIDLMHRDPNYVAGRTSVTRRYGSDCPPNFSLDIEVAKTDGDLETSSWLFAESYWADSFPMPNVAKLSLWSILVTPWVLANFAGNRFRRHHNKFVTNTDLHSLIANSFEVIHFLTNIILIPYWLTIFILTQLGLIIIMIASLIPFDVVQNYSERALRLFSAAIGDCYSFASSSVREAMIVEQVRRDMRWLSGRCERLVILAHSQGAAIAYTTLKEYRPDNLRLLVTLGSGLKKLLIIQKLTFPGITHVHITIGVGFAVIYLMLSFCLGFLASDIYSVKVVGFEISPAWYSKIFLTSAILTVFGLASLWISFGTDEYQEDIRDWAESLRNRGVSWLDCFGSKDPVSDGPTFGSDDESRPEDAAPPRWTRREVHNFGSIFFDHTSYASNRDECLSAIVTEISRCVDPKVRLHNLGMSELNVMQRSSMLRRARVRQLTYIPTLAAIMSIIIVWARWNALGKVGGIIELYFGKLEITKWVVDIFGIFPDHSVAIGLVCHVLCVTTAFTIPYMAWRFWNWLEMRAFFNRRFFPYNFISGSPNGVVIYACTLSLVMIELFKFAAGLPLLSSNIYFFPIPVVLSIIILYSRRKG